MLSLHYNCDHHFNHALSWPPLAATLRITTATLVATLALRLHPHHTHALVVATPSLQPRYYHLLACRTLVLPIVATCCYTLLRHRSLLYSRCYTLLLLLRPHSPHCSHAYALTTTTLLCGYCYCSLLHCLAVTTALSWLHPHLDHGPVAYCLLAATPSCVTTAPLLRPRSCGYVHSCVTNDYFVRSIRVTRFLSKSKRTKANVWYTFFFFLFFPSFLLSLFPK
jgi:hypothetical protein